MTSHAFESFRDAAGREVPVQTNVPRAAGSEARLEQ
jgi:hypothetical protein